MGVPAFYRWLSEKYPKIIQDVLEERTALNPDGTACPPDWSRPNPSGLECDNLYLDLNGIIHPCAHPEHGPTPETEPDMYEAVCRYIDRLCYVIRPRRLLYIAIDGVAPRAKMNQQRARRFRSAQEARELAELEAGVRAHLLEQGDDAPPPKPKPWDSNVITPGTPFMISLAEYIRFYIRKRFSQNKAWRELKVIFSDASIPGEGEHKIMSHIRMQRSQPGYNPNRVHVLHGLDADLIMLALATHEAHFYISREEVTFGRKSMEMQEHRQTTSGYRDQQDALNRAVGEEAMQLPENAGGKPFQRVSIPILREYLSVEFEACLNKLPFRANLERLIDDIVFLCFFVGNDFLPHLPSLDIRDGALDFLFNVYKHWLPQLGDYLTKSGGQVNLSAVNVILDQVGKIEDYVFAMKHDNENRAEEMAQAARERRNKERRGQAPDAPPAIAITNAATHARRGRSAKILERSEAGPVAAARPNAKSTIQVSHKTGSKQQQRAGTIQVSHHRNKKDNLQAAENLKAQLLQRETKVKAEAPPATGGSSALDATTAKRKPTVDAPEQTAKRIKKEASTDGVGYVGDAQDEFVDDDGEGDDDDKGPTKPGTMSKDPDVAKSFKNKVKEMQDKKLDEYRKNVQDNVRLHEAGWKDRYYSDKCKAEDVSQHGGREHLFRSYIVGLCWVMKYYYDGCPSWKWYFPFHYAPFASDLKNVERFQKECRNFALGRPFNPVEQLMAVLPSDSSHAIPKESRWLMLDLESPIIDFYPQDVPVDPNGKAMPWLWVVLLPFIDEDRLLDALAPTMAKWSKEELFCNARGMDDGYLYIHKSNQLSQKFKNVLVQTNKASYTKLDAAAYNSPGFFGSVRPPLSNELYPLTDEREDVKILLPSTAGVMKNAGPDGLFTEDLECNLAVCVSFAEPKRLPHKSVLLPGARPPRPCLTDEDKRIRTPRLGRGASIAHMGGGGGSNRGSGSIHISSQERELAVEMGRGHQMYQTGVRAWGAMEPVPKQFQRRREIPNPFLNNGGPAQNSHHDQGRNRPYESAPPRGFHPQHGQEYSNYHGNNINRSQHSHFDEFGRPQNPPRQDQQHWDRQNMNDQRHQYGRSYQHQQAPPPHPGQHHQPYQASRWGAGRNPPPPPPPPPGNHRFPAPSRGPPQHQPSQHQPQQGFSFRNAVQNGPPRQPPPYRRDSQSEQQRSRASADAMKNLRAQLSSTLRQNRRGHNG